jgi:hypothetical protein
VTRTVTGHSAFTRGRCVGALIVTRTGDASAALVAACDVAPFVEA